MVKRGLTGLFFLFCFFLEARSSHITGGEMFYRVTGFSNGYYTYNVTLKLFQRCNSGRQFPNPAIISIFDKGTGNRITDLNVALLRTENISITNPDPCISNPPAVCYDVAFYNFTISLSPSIQGYVIASQVNYRINGINNLDPGSGNVGATYTAEIPGIGSLGTAPSNISAYFAGSDLVVVCANNPFSYSFRAVDDDGDELKYSFCGAYNSTSEGGGNPQPPTSPPYPQVPYYSPEFDSNIPLGNQVQINQNTGLITGIAPDVGIYVVTVCVQEIRNGVVIATQRKDIQINVADCDIAAAVLLPEYNLCRDSQTLTIANQSTSPLIQTTDWEFTDDMGNVIHTSTSTAVTYTFPATGIYHVKLVINRNGLCADSTEALIRVFPGFRPNFNVAGMCLNKPTFFTDLTTSVYGVPNSWSWDFGEPSVLTDFSSDQNPQYTYPAVGVKNVRLIATDTRGCRDTAYQTITIDTNPPLLLAFKDTLICRGDILTLNSGASGTFNWTPLVNITNPNTASPTVSPTATTTYFVDLDDNGCTNRDSVKVNVVNFVTLNTMSDTTICTGDAIQLRIISDGLQYNWTPAGQISNPFIQNPVVITPSTTNYQVTAIIGGCSATDNILVTTVDYPVANAGPDTAICYNTPVFLQGTTNGNSWSWSPAQYLSNPSSLNPTGYLTGGSTEFIFSAYDTRGCPKPGIDTIRVIVAPKMNVSAGADTSVVINQPIQLQATGATYYTWYPPDYLSTANIPDPIAIFDLGTEDIRYKVVGASEEGCLDSAYITIKVFKTGPSVFVPSAFTPNNDGLNDQLKPIAVGMKSIERFVVFNRWGQQVFITSINGQGWDGRINGQLQSTGTYVWMVQATDFNGTAYFSKGTVTLIR